ncbi:MAG TPA: LuxR C-terminal-related transcriptional regulator [Rhizobacter sp.]|nr:LuxR C-terminal-related transcriptional regulator [Rhizobacter sp.]
MQNPLPTASFALAKIQPPRPRSALVERPQLERALGHALQHQRLTLLLAPAGYGKTSALARQIRQLPEGCALAWVSADEDDQLQRFLACLATALEPFDLPWRMSPDALALLSQGEQGLRDVVAELVNALAGVEAERGLIVIDDAHRLGDPRLFTLLQSLLERLPAPWGLVVSSRVEPPLSLARLRAEGELAEFRQFDLRFSEDEVAALLAAQPEGAAQPASARELMERTDGWAAGLRLSLSARPGAPRTQAPTQRHLFDYLVSEVLADLPEPLRTFLLRCSVLPELSAARCAHVSGDAQAAQWLEEIERRGLFASVVETEEFTLRLHDLFRDFLEDRLQREQPDALPELLRRAAEHEPDLARAVGYLARAGAWDEATTLLVKRAQEQLSIGAGSTLERLLRLFPEAEFARRPDLHLVRGLAAWPHFDWATLLRCMQAAAEGFAAAGRRRDAVLARANLCSGLHHAGRLTEATRELAALRAQKLDDAARAFVCYTGAWDAFAAARTDEVAPVFTEMLGALERTPVPALWMQFPTHCVFVGLPGMHPLLERFAQGATRVCGDAPTQLRAAVMHIRAWLALTAGRLDDAGQWLARAEEDCHWLGMPRLVVTEHRLARVIWLALRGEREACHATARELVDDLRLHSPLSHRRVHESEVLFVHARAAWVLQDHAALRQIDADLQRAANEFEWPAAPLNRAMSQAFVALADGRNTEAQALLEPLARDINRSLFYPATQARLMLADLLAQQGRIADAAATLQAWFDEVRDGREIGAGLLAGPQVLGRLQAVAWGKHVSASDAALLGQLSAQTVRSSAEPKTNASPARTAGVAGLSERETEVLARIAAGDSNKLIARAFDLSPHTVKRHVANILGKLGVDTRGQAAAAYRSQEH